MGIITSTKYFLKSKGAPEENLELPRNSISPRKSLLCSFSTNKRNPLKFTNESNPEKQLQGIKVVLDVNKPLYDVGLAMVNLKILKTAIETLINSLKLLVNGADIALRNAKRPHCHVCIDKHCLLKSETCLWEFEKFGKLIRAGGPMCALQTRKDWGRFDNTFIGESATAQCDSAYEHDHLHITNHHRILLENMQLELKEIKILYRQVKCLNWLHYTELGKLGKNKGKNCKAIVDFTDFYKVKREYEWVWGSGLNIGSWSDIEDACRDVLELQVLGICKFDKRILTYSATHGSADQLYIFNEGVSVAHNSYVMPISPFVMPQKTLFEQCCHWCIGSNPPKIRGRKAEEDNGEKTNPIEVKVPVGGEIEGFRIAMALRTVFKVTLVKPFRAKHRRLTAKEKGKQNSEVVVSAEEERELYNIIQPPRCIACELWVDATEIFEEAGRHMKAKSEASGLYVKTVRCVSDLTRYDRAIEVEARTPN